MVLFGILLLVPLGQKVKKKFFVKGKIVKEKIPTKLMLTK